MAVTDTQSYSLVIRDIFYDALDRDAFFANHHKRKTKMLVSQPPLLPYLGVYIIDETMTPDGDSNATCIRFSHSLRIGFSAIVANNDQVVAEKQIDAAFWRIMNVLWTDQYILNLIDTYNPHLGVGNPDNTRIESITRGTRRHVFGSSQFNNETPLAEVQYDVTCFYRTMWWPDITDTLDEIDVKTGIKIGDTQEEMDERQQLHVNYNFTETAQAQPSKRSMEDGRSSHEGFAPRAAAARANAEDQGRETPRRHPRRV
jgi:hypothetical protein